MRRGFSTGAPDGKHLLRWARRWIWATVAGLLLVSSSALAEDDEEDGSKLPYRGSRLSYTSSATAISFAPDAELTYNPYLAMKLKARPKWWFNEVWYVDGEIAVAGELTNSDTTTRRNELVLSDAEIHLGGENIYTIPWLDLELSAEAELIAPTSKAAQGDSLILGTAIYLGVARSFDVLDGLELGYTVSPAKYFHQYTTSSYAGPTVIDCATSPGGCARFSHSGARNVSWALTHELSVALSPVKSLTLWAYFSPSASYLYPRAELPGVSVELADAVNARYLNWYLLAAVFTPSPAVSIWLGTTTLNPQLAPDSRYYPPLFNRYTRFFVDVRLSLEGVMDQLAEI